MNIDKLLAEMTLKKPPASEVEIIAFESEIGYQLPSDYRQFLKASNGGYIGGRFWFKDGDTGIDHIGGFREESHFSLRSSRDCYADRIPNELLWIMDDPFGNAICIGVVGETQGRIYFWDHEAEPDPASWDGSAANADNVSVLANSFTDFVAGLTPLE